MGNVDKSSPSDGFKKLPSRKTPEKKHVKALKESKSVDDHGCCSFDETNPPPLEFIDTEDDQTEMKSDTRVRLFWNRLLVNDLN